MQLSDLKHVYFLGIGGIGMSAIARYFVHRGVIVSGYDRTATPLTDQLSGEGMNIVFDGEPTLIPRQIDLVVYTPAIPQDHAGFAWLKSQDIPMMKRSEVLGLISNGMRSVCIAGTHGKTTTSTMTAHLLTSSALSVSAFLGGIASDYGTNYLLGSGDVVVLEADEYDRSFLRLSPWIATISSLDADHLDIYGDLEGMMEGYSQFVARIREGGTLIIKQGLLSQLNAEVVAALPERHIKVYEFGEEAADISLHNIRVENGHFLFDYKGLGNTIEDVEVSLPGRHNLENAAVAITAGLILGADVEAMKHALRTFKGIQRRFERVFSSVDTEFIDDYAHHPGELNVAISAARELFPGKHLTGVFQPHLYTRTRDFADGFAEALDKLDRVFLMDIYPARELPIEGVTSNLIFDKMTLEDKTLVTKRDLMAVLSSCDVEVLLTLGAGDIDTFVPQIKQMLQKQTH